MLDCYVSEAEQSIPISLIQTSDYDQWLAQQDSVTQAWLKANTFQAQHNQYCLLPDTKGQMVAVILGVNDNTDVWLAGHLAKSLPATKYHFAHGWSDDQLQDAALAWGLGAYQFKRYKKTDDKRAQLNLSHVPQAESIQHKVAAIYQVRDLINTPTEDMGPAQLARAAKQLADDNQAHYKEWLGEQLLQDNFPAIHTVGRASGHEPRLLELQWGDSSLPHVILVGKGVCFDTGGLNLKPGRFMRHMKKDMAGAAHVLGLAQLIMAEHLPVHLRVLIPAVENSVAGNAYRPGDVLQTRKGLTVEVSNTDAEGRLVLADALTYGCEQQADLVIDFATLTGAARAAVGTDIAALFCNDESVAHQLRQSSDKMRDPLWQLPLYQAYRKLLDSNIADIDNSSDVPYAGAITAALFLQEFVGKDIPWVHIDMMAWNQSARPGRPEGGEAHALRAMFDFLQSRYKGI